MYVDRYFVYMYKHKANKTYYLSVENKRTEYAGLQFKQDELVVWISH